MKLSTRQILFIGLIFFIITASTSIGYHHSDEHWQLLEFANFKLGRSPQYDLASEYGKEMRSAFQPSVAFLTIRFLEGIGIKNPFDVAFVLRILSCVLGWFAFTAIVIKSKKLGINEEYQKLLAAISMFLWFIPYTSCRFSNENYSGIFFCFAIIIVGINSSTHWKYFLLAGVLIGISYLCRFQILFAAIGLLAWMAFIKKLPMVTIIIFLSGFFIVFVIGLFIDQWFYGHFTFTAYNYFYANIIKGVASSFGVSPWWYYFNMVFESAAAPISIVILAGYFYSLCYFRLHAFHWAVFFFVLGHCLVGHKELRFLFPMIYLLPFILVLGFGKATKNGKNYIQKSRLIKLFFGLVLIENGLLLLVIALLKPAEETTSFNQFIYTLASKQPVTIFYIDKDPYQFGDQRQYFYCPKNLSLQRIENDSTIMRYKPAANSLLLVYDEKFYASENVKAYIGKPVFKTFPLWLSNVNYGNWLSRAKSWSLYELKKSNKLFIEI